MYTVKFDIVIAVLKKLTICTRTTLGDDISQGAWWPYKYKNKTYTISFNWRLKIFWNWFLELKM